MKNCLNPVLFLMFLGVIFSSCEDVIDVDLDNAPPQLSVDAWLTDSSTTQEVRLFLTQPYFDNSEATPILNAQVQVLDNEGRTFVFTDENNDGIYLWNPSTPDEAIGKLGNTYTLTIDYQGDTFQAFSEVKRVPEIDSLTTEFRDDEVFGPDGYYAELFARDFVGSGDTYWIRTFKNGQLLNRAFDVNIAFDAGFSEGGNIDGLTFITPIREGVNPFYEDPEDDSETLPPYEVGDSIYVEIYSITEDAFNFWSEVSTQLGNGGLFAVPLSNVRTNIFNVNPESSEEPVGYFGVCAVSSVRAVVEEEE